MVSWPDESSLNIVPQPEPKSPNVPGRRFRARAAAGRITTVSMQLVAAASHKRVIELTARSSASAYADLRAVLMSYSRLPLNSFERFLFGMALLLGATLILCRVGSMMLVSYLHHFR